MVLPTCCLLYALAFAWPMHMMEHAHEVAAARADHTPCRHDAESDADHLPDVGHNGSCATCLMLATSKVELPSSNPECHDFSQPSDVAFHYAVDVIRHPFSLYVAGPRAPPRLS